MRKGFRIAAGIDNLFRTLSYNIKGDIPVRIIIDQVYINVVYFYVRCPIDADTPKNIPIIFQAVAVHPVYIFYHFRQGVKSNRNTFLLNEIIAYFLNNPHPFDMVRITVRNRKALYLGYFLSVAGYRDFFRCIYKHFYIINIQAWA